MQNIARSITLLNHFIFIRSFAIKRRNSPCFVSAFNKFLSWLSSLSYIYIVILENVCIIYRLPIIYVIALKPSFSLFSTRKENGTVSYKEQKELHEIGLLLVSVSSACKKKDFDNETGHLFVWPETHFVYCFRCICV